MLLSTFIIQYYSKVVVVVVVVVVVFIFFLFFFNFISHHLNWIIIMDMCVQFIIVASYDEFITYKVL